jgi:hypothetical protein
MSERAYGADEHGISGDYREDPVSINFRYGYQVGDGKPRLVGNGTSDRAHAVREAKLAAEKVRGELRSLGAPDGVNAWIQKRKRTVTIEFSEPEVVPA